MDLLSRPLRRSLALVAAGSLLLGACGGSSDSGDGGGGGGAGGGDGDLPECPVDALDGVTEPVEVVVWHTQQAKPLDTLEALAEEYNAAQDAVRVRLESQGSSYQELQRKFEEAVPSQDLPALVVFDDTATQIMADSGVILPAQACMEADGTDPEQFLEVARNYYTIDGVLWPASANLGNILLYYNRDHFERAGLDPDDPPETLAELRAAAEAIKAAGVVDRPLVHELSSWKTEFWLTGAGAPVVDNDNGRGEGDTVAGAFEGNDDALELFEWLAAMESDGLMTAIPRAEGAIDQYLAMAQRSASMLIESSSAATSIEAFLGGDTDVVDGADAVDVSGLELGAAVLPGLREPGTTQMGGAAWYLTNTGSAEKQAAAWDFMRFLNTPGAQVDLLVGGSYLPYVTAANDEPEAQEFYESSLSGQWLAIANDQIAAIDPAFPGPLIGPYYDFREAVEDGQDELLVGGATPAEALAQIQSAVTEALERYQEEGF